MAALVFCGTCGLAFNVISERALNWELFDKLSPREKILATKELFRRSLYHTAKSLLGYKEINHRTHDGTIRALKAKTKRKLIVLPRGCFKSSIGSVAYPINLLINDWNERILLDSEIYSNSKNFLREIKSHLESERFKLFFGQSRNDTCWNEGEILVNQRTKIYKEASITASGIGAEKTGQHYSTIICDDLNSPSNSSTQEGRDKVIQHYRYLTSILEPEGTLVVIGTRYSELDIPGFILRNEVEDEVSVEAEQRSEPQTVYLLVGTPGSGKTWVAKQLTEKYEVVQHDDYIKGGYLEAVEKQARRSPKPVLAETPFSISEIKKPLEDRGIRVVPVFILESEDVTASRYLGRERKAIPQGHLTRINTYRQRAVEMRAAQGTSIEILEHLRNLK